LGPVINGTFLDTEGRVILWNPESPIESISRPIAPHTPHIPYAPHRPYRPHTPFRPHKPGTPINGWSKLAFSHWISE